MDQSADAGNEHVHGYVEVACRGAFRGGCRRSGRGLGRRVRCGHIVRLRRRGCLRLCVTGQRLDLAWERNVLSYGGVPVVRSPLLLVSDGTTRYGYTYRRGTLRLVAESPFHPRQQLYYFLRSGRMIEK